MHVTGEDTIAAIATGLGGGVAIIRISGPDALAIGNRVWKGRKLLSVQVARQLLLGAVAKQDSEIDDCLAVYMPGPRSYTAEDVVELQCHGGTFVARAVLAAVLSEGARHAAPGEFTKRAYLNGRLDLTQAEAVADVISAQSEMALHTAHRQLQGHLRQRVAGIDGELREMLAEIEVRMDFVDEDLDWTAEDQLHQALQNAERLVRELLLYRQEGEVLREGIRLVLAGAPNAGKSSLLNLLLGHDRAIVTDVPGTTRDTLEEYAHIREIPVRLIDTAGLRETEDVVERAGIDRSHDSIRGAQLLIWVIDLTAPLDGQQLDPALVAGRTVIAAANKCDLHTGELPALDVPIVAISARNGDGIEALRDAVEAAVWAHPHDQEPDVAVSVRHAAELDRALLALVDARAVLQDAAFELVAVNLRAALEAMGAITGTTARADILDNIFGKFCIGK